MKTTTDYKMRGVFIEKARPSKWLNRRQLSRWLAIMKNLKSVCLREGVDLQDKFKTQ